jgi:MFS transporter, OFA family, oxalate/formate antiporter
MKNYKLMENKWIRGAIPALLIHCCIGTVYCWSLLKGNIATLMGTSVSSIEFAFSLAIFFLGMSAAFGGRFVEKNVKRSSLLAMLCFSGGLLGTIYAINLQSVPLLFLFYGGIMGIGLGLGYLSPVKTLMLWFSEHKGLATGIAISGFGLSKALFSPFITWCNDAYGVNTTLACISGVAILCMGAASWLIRKPKNWHEDTEKFSVSGALKTILNPVYLKIWLVFYLNITCGLALIAFEKDLAQISGLGWIGLLASLTAIFNTLGRFGYSTVSDWIKDKSKVYLTIFGTSILAMILPIVFGIKIAIIVVMLCIINAGYGGGFSTLPTFLESKFGMKKISMIHGFALSAWGWAGLSGNQLSNLVLNHYHGTFNDLFIVLCSLYVLALFVTYEIHPRRFSRVSRKNL